MSGILSRILTQPLGLSVYNVSRVIIVDFTLCSQCVVFYASLPTANSGPSIVFVYHLVVLGCDE